MANEYKNYLKQMFAGGKIQPRELNTIPATIGMPQGATYPLEDLKRLYNKYVYYTRDPQTPSVDGVPQYVINMPKWLAGKDSRGLDYATDDYPDLPQHMPRGRVTNVNPLGEIITDYPYLLNPKINYR